MTLLDCLEYEVGEVFSNGDLDGCQKKVNDHFSICSDIHTTFDKVEFKKSREQRRSHFKQSFQTLKSKTTIIKT